jgi:hypothetical protein
MTVRRRFIAFGCLAIATMVYAGAPTSALESEGFTITDERLSQSKDFGPIALFNPSAQAVEPTLDDCKSLPSDNAVKITFAIKSTVPTKSIFSVSWDAPPEANDIDVYFFTDEGDLISDAASSANPEVFQLGGLENGVYWVCVRNFSGVNPGFTLSVKANFLSLFEPPPPPPTANPFRTPTVKPPVDDEPDAPATPAVTPEAVETPGADGTTEEQELIAVSGPKQAAPADEGRSGLSVGLLAATGLIVATGTGLVFVRIRRDTRLD